MLKDKLIAQNENVRSFLFKNSEHINTISLEKRKKVKATILDQDLLAEYHILHLLAIPYRAFPSRETLAAWLKDLQADLVKGNISRSNRLYTQVMELQKNSCRHETSRCPQETGIKKNAYICVKQ
jgi:hypothetical protein